MTLQTRLDGNVIQSGSIPVTAITNFTEALTVALPVGTISGSAQVVNALPTNTVSSSAQVTAFLPANTVSSSGQIQLDAITGTTFATTNFTFPQAVTASNVLITGIATVRELQTLLVTSSIIFESGSTKFGDTADDTHQFTGSLSVLGNVSSSMGFSGSGANITNIPNSGLVNSSVTVNGTAISLGGSGTVTAAAGTLSGTTLASGVTASSLTSVGTLSSLTVSGNLTVDTDTLFVDAVNNRVGIGTTSPVGKLQIGATTGVTSPGSIALAIRDGTSPEYGFDFNLEGVATGDMSLMRTILSTQYQMMTFQRATGNVGIGTTSPEALLHINKATSGGEGGYIYIDNPATSASGNKAGIKFGTSNGASFASVPTGEITNVITSAGDGASALTFGTFNGSASGERMRIDASGNVGIGVTPSAWDVNRRVLQVGGSGALWANATGSGFLFLSNNLYYDGSNFRYLNTAASGYYTIASDGTHRWNHAASGTAGTPITFTESMRINASGNVGIGTTSPTAKLQISDGVDATGSYSSLILAKGSSYGETTFSTFYTSIGNYGTTIGGLLTIDIGSGNVGIGTTSPATKLAIVDGSGVGVEINPSGAIDSGAYIQAYNRNAATYAPLVSYSTSRIWWVNGAERMRITSAGNVGIGTTSPSQALHVNGFVRLLGISVNETGGTISAFIGYEKNWLGTGSSNSLAIASETGNNIKFYTNGSATERASITTVGTLNVGGNPDSGAVGAYVTGYNGFTAQVSNNAFYNFSGTNASGTRTFYVEGNGNVLNTNNSYGQISDLKLKQDVVDAASQWDDIKGVRVRKFRFKNNPDGPLQIGVVAQELEAVSPGLIDATPDYEGVEVTDEDGNVTTERVALGTVTKSVKYSVLYMKSIKALQEAMTRIEALETSNAELMARIDTLES